MYKLGNGILIKEKQLSNRWSDDAINKRNDEIDRFG